MATEVPQTLEYRGGQLNVAPVLEVENFTNWKKRFMCHIIGIEPQFENIISNGPFIPILKALLEQKNGLAQRIVTIAGVDNTRFVEVTEMFIMHQAKVIGGLMFERCLECLIHRARHYRKRFDGNGVGREADLSLAGMMKYVDAFRFSLGELRTTLCSSVKVFERLLYLKASRAQSWVLQDHILCDSGICGMDDDYVFALACLRDTILIFNFSGFTKKDTAPSKAQQTLANVLFSEMVKDMEIHFDMTIRQKAVFECLRASHAQDFLLVIPIDGLGQHMSPVEYRTILKYCLMIPLFLVDAICHVCRKACLDSFGEHAVHCKELSGFKYRHDMVRDVLFDICRRARISSNKEAPVNFLTDASDGRSTLRPAADALIFGWVGGKHACVDLTSRGVKRWSYSAEFMHINVMTPRSTDVVFKPGNILKLMLGYGELQCIGATTLGEYNEYFEKDPSFECCFKQVYVIQPTEEDTVTILRGLRERIKAALSHIVDENQNAFVPGRAITDNILLTQELLKGYNCANGPKRCSFKIDIQKAYDTVSWNFIEDVLKYFRFPDKMRWQRFETRGPISPYLFTMVMEVLNLIVKDEIKKCKEFKFHFGCKQLKITHLCFADDLSILSDEAKSEICSIFPFKEAVRYLGVPLITKKIGVNDCKQLVDKVKKKLNDWKNKNLSYAGVDCFSSWFYASLLGSVFLLPKIVIKDIESCFKKFLWNSGDSCKGKAKIAWLDVCKPKDQGGLGFKSLELWNKTLHGILLQEKNHFGLNGLIQWIGDHIRHKIGDGKSISVWHDKWYNGISLSSLISKKEVFYAGFKDHDSIQDIPNFTNPDKTVWIDNNGNEKNFSTNTVWKDVRGNDAKVCWKNVVWHPNCIPKHTFILWLAAKGRLCTQDKLMKWYPNKSYECSLCKKMPDSHDHLFFGCEYAQKFWKMICEIANLKIKADKWDKILEELSNDNDNKSFCGVIRKLYLRAKLVSIKVKNSKNVLQAEAKWNVKFTRWKADADTSYLFVCRTLQMMDLNNLESNLGYMFWASKVGCPFYALLKEDRLVILEDEAAPKLKKEITSKPTALDEINRSLLQLEMEGYHSLVLQTKFTRKWTGIPLSKLKQSEMAKLLHLEEELHKGVVGQNTTVTAVAEAFQRPTAGLSDPHHPIFTKLEFSNGTAEILKTNEQNNPRFDGFTMGYIETDLLNIIAYS
ncbi:putative reverse transcriptase domain-containing protein [Tanacetum coccineum]